MSRTAHARPARKPASLREIAQQCADAYLEIAQALDAQAKRYRAEAAHYRTGALLPGYAIPDGIEACAEARHPAARAIDGLDYYRHYLHQVEDRVRAALQAGIALALLLSVTACSGGPVGPSPQPPGQIAGGCRIVHHPATTRTDFVEVVPGVVRPVVIDVPAWTETICAAGI